MVAKGPRCLFAEFYSRTRKLSEITFSFELALDTHVVDGLVFYRSTAKPSPSNKWFLALQVIMQYRRNNVRVLWLGDIEADWDPRRRRFNRKQVGLLLTRAGQKDDEDREDLPYQRLGVCTWVAGDDEVEEVMNKLPWDDVELQLH